MTIKSKKINTKSGFTLLEILLVVGIISILAGIVIVAVNPVKQLNAVRNAQRMSDIKQINNAVLQYYIKNFEYPAGITSTITEICDTGELSTLEGSEVTCTDLVDLTPLVPEYLAAIPVDPLGPVVAVLNKIINTAYAATGGTGYQIKIDSDRIGVQSIREPSIVVGMEPEGGDVGGEDLGISGLLAHYKMNDTSGTAVDDTQGSDGTASEDISGLVDASGQIGGALTFDGSTNYITTGYKFYPSTGSMSLWIKSTAPSGYDFIVGTLGVSPAFYLVDGVMNIDIAGNAYGGMLNGIIPVNDGEWHHVVWTWDGSTGTSYLYVDNTLEGSGTGSWTMSDPGYNFQIARRQDGWGEGAGNGFDGSLDDIRLYDKVLTEEEIASIWNDGAGTEAE